MSCFDKLHYKELKQQALEDGVLLATSDTETEEYNGLSIAVLVPRNPGMRMIEVAVSYCSPEDEFKRKHGKYQALLKFYSGEVVKLPLAKAYFADKATLMSDLLDHFTV